MTDSVSALEQDKPQGNRGRMALVFVCVAALWLLFDIVTKVYFSDTYQVGSTIASPLPSIFQFQLVHNTGAAWGMFGNSTFALGVMSIVVCTLLVVYLFVFARDVNMGQVVGVALVFAGGIGNALDRFMLGYVVDFIEPTFINFPVFNIADIGVTCGFIVFVLALICAWQKNDALAKQQALNDVSEQSTVDPKEPTP